MKAGYFVRLAVTGVKNNRKFYLPYFLTCVGMVMMQYIITSLPYSPAMRTMKGAEPLGTLLILGAGVVAIFSALFLFYTHSFLMRRRKKEFGLYNILGMDKLGIGRILAWETLLVGGAALALGVLGGAVFAKLAELIITRIMESQISYDITFSWTAMALTSVVFGIIFLLILIWSILQVSVSSTISLLRSENAGEKAPRANWLMGALGFVVLAAAYGIALFTENPLTALVLFFVAVVMVIVATYAIMISGSVMFCRLLQKRTDYYYHRRHFVSVSSMAYRMKRNGAGLASICVLSTMVLVMMVSSVSLYVGMNKSVNERYPRENCAYARLNIDEIGKHTDMRFFRDLVDSAIEESGAPAENKLFYRNFNVFGRVEGDCFDLVSADTAGIWSAGQSMNQLCDVNVVPLEDLNAQMGTDYALNPGQALIFCHDTRYEYPVFRFGGLTEYQIVGEIEEDWPFFNNMAQLVSDSITLFVPDFDESLLAVRDFALEDGMARNFFYFCVYSFDSAENLQQPIASRLQTFLSENSDQYQHILRGYFVENRTEAYSDYLGVYGGLLFLGILLSIVFLSATVLIIYYKQVTEGFEDQARFGIMQKVGMTKPDIRASINSQIRTVFFLPLAMAALHTLFAIPILTRMFRIFGFVNLRLILLTGGISLIVFAVFYVIVYRVTAGAYFGIVSEAKE